VLEANRVADDSARIPRSHAMLRYADWPIAVKLITLTVGGAALLAAGLTALAYTGASAGLTALAGVLLTSVVVFFTARRIGTSVSQVAAAARATASEDLSALEGVAKAHAAARFEALVQNAADVILIQTEDGSVTYASPAALQAWGRHPESLVGGVVLEELAHPDDRGLARAFIAQVNSATDSSVTVELRIAHVDGSWREMDIIGTNLLNHLPVGGLVLTCRDVSQHKRLERQLRRESDRMLALHRASTALAGPTADTDAALNEVLRNAISLIGGSSGSLHRWDAQAGVLRAVYNRDVNERHATPDIQPGQGIVGQTFSQCETVIVNDYRSWEHARGPARGGNLSAGLGVPLMRDGKCLGVLTLRVYGDDPTRFSEDDGRIASLFARQAAEALYSADAFQEQRHAALHDALTGLPNRVSLQNQLQVAYQAVSADHSRSFALMILDLDRFKEVNDTLGHHVGDVLLQQLGRTLEGAVRATDLVARLGGDEFAVLLPSTDAVGAVVVAKNLVHALEDPFLLEGHPIAVDASIGIAIAPEHGRDADTLMRCADVAMYQAKRSGVGVALYTAADDIHRPDRLALLGELRTAIDNGELLLHYQPKLDMHDGSLVGVEALVRWLHPQRGFLPPMEFIPLAEQTGLIYPLSQWVLDAALKQHQAWANMGMYVPVAVNLSRRTLHDPQMPEMVATLLDRWNVAPGALVLEITESGLMADPQRATENLMQLRNRGVRISIDDFGTGYSSLASLKNLSVDELKIDRSFVQAMATDASSRAIVRSVIDLADALKLRAVAEGVEDRDTWDVLAALGCEVAQGYFLSRPVAAAELEAWMAQVAPSWLVAAEVRDLDNTKRERSRERESRLTAEEEFIARKQAEAALRVSEERNRLALQAASMGTWDLVGESNTWPPETEALYGLEPGTFEGTFDASRRLMHPDDWPSFRAEIKAALLERRDSHATYRTVWPDGSVHWLESKGRAVFGPDGEVARVIGTTMDITERKQAEAELRASEDRFRRSYKGFPLPTYSWVQLGDDFVLEDFNDAADAVTDGKIREWLGNRASEQFADQPEMLASLRRCVAEQRTVRREQHYATSGSEMGRDLASTYVFVPPRMVMAHIEDITPVKSLSTSWR
jgi:diguanylate cyclase (GGDEF)-like protein/PAS domain S-box-containing protein